MAIDRAVFAGQPVAAVAADELAIADEALDLIEVEYEVLPAAVDPIKSMQWDAPQGGRRGHRGRHVARRWRTRASRATASEDGQDRPERRPDVEAGAGRRGGGVRRGRLHPGEDVPRPDGPPGVHRGARDGGRLRSIRPGRSRSGRAPRARSTPAPRSRTCCTSRRRRSRSSRWSAAAASGRRSAR